jgi:hypothetical protein
MKIYTPPQELINLDLVLKYDTEHTPILSQVERSQINWKRAKLMRNEPLALHPALQQKIDFNINQIEKENWKPESPVVYNVQI